ncbi:HhH-GPD-type base excision DNA repair protein [Kitasatospora sp. NPDC101801]|uniref:HhH-GPD-type base excision DNA repair protein n=1 Tax=Kitasatospora sp. NPDC101801 TaxID=3364103 RepID=UPI003800E860
MKVIVPLAHQPAADELLGRSPLAALIGVLLDEHVPTESAFTAPLKLARRLGRGDLDAGEIAAYDPYQFTALFKAQPALHRSPAWMARRVQLLCTALVARHDGDATKLWEGARTGAQLLRRLATLPGFGEQKSQLYVALLGMHYGVRPEGWREAAGIYGEGWLARSDHGS